MDYVLFAFQAVSLIFAASAVATGAQAVLNPISFSKLFGLPLNTAAVKDQHSQRGLAMSYVSLMGVRQLGTGLILLLFAYQRKWVEAATILAIIGLLVAGTDGAVLYRAGHRRAGLQHAIPGALIAALAGAVVYSSA